MITAHSMITVLSTTGSATGDLPGKVLPATDLVAGQVLEIGRARDSEVARLEASQAETAPASREVEAGVSMAEAAFMEAVVASTVVANSMVPVVAPTAVADSIVPVVDMAGATDKGLRIIGR